MVQKILHMLVVSFFALVGAGNLIDGLGYLRYPWTAPGVFVNYYPGEMTILTGILFLMVALGIFRYYSWARMTAIVIAGLWAVVMAVVLVKMPSLVSVLLFMVLLFILAWLLSPAVRATFIAGKAQAKTA